ncbi:MAG: signal peptidase I [Alphaproteobacteria bacterium]|nr:signal peptidase I [Alphaproteobacteria bacterium]
MVAIALAMAVDLVRLSIRQPDYKLCWYNRWWVYLGTFLIGNLVSFGPELLGGSAAQTVRTFSIPSVSGAPALQLGDYIVVNNQAYRQTDPSRGDVAVFTLPRDENIVWIKRVIGLPGDRIQLKNGMLFINDAMVRREPAGNFARAGGPPRAQFREHLPGGRSYLTLDAGPSAGDNTAVMTVPAGHYFLLGDNRDNSSDSRFPHIGPVPRALMLGRATGVIFADDLSRIGSKIK